MRMLCRPSIAPSSRTRQGAAKWNCDMRPGSDVAIERDALTAEHGFAKTAAEEEVEVLLALDDISGRRAFDGAEIGHDVKLGVAEVLQSVGRGVGRELVEIDGIADR